MAPPEKMSDFLAVRQIGENEYESLHNPERMGNTAPIAYGGCTIGIAASSAAHTVKPGFFAYSFLGHYLGPALVDRHLFSTVETIRDTRTFATRSVRVFQKLDDGNSRVCMFVIVDFQTQEPVDLLTYSASPTREWEHWSKCPTVDQSMQRIVDTGGLTMKQAKGIMAGFTLKAHYFDERNCPGSMFTELMIGAAKHLPSSQDHLTLPERVSGDWVKVKTDLKSHSEQISALGFVTDAALSFVPLTHSHLFLMDAGACSSLDFAMRIFDNKLDISKWHLRELQTVTGGEGRTYTRARLWNEQGKMVSEMTQQCILRPKPGPKEQKGSKI
jgi:acyl-CoA thioesterase II